MRLIVTDALLRLFRDDRSVIDHNDFLCRLNRSLLPLGWDPYYRVPGRYILLAADSLQELRRGLPMRALILILGLLVLLESYLGV